MDNIICDDYKCMLYTTEHPFNQHIFCKTRQLFKKCIYETCNCFVVGKDTYCHKHLSYLYNNENYQTIGIKNPINTERELNIQQNETLIYDKNLEIMRQQLINMNLNQNTNNVYNVPPPSPC